MIDNGTNVTVLRGLQVRGTVVDCYYDSASVGSYIYTIELEDGHILENIEECDITLLTNQWEIDALKTQIIIPGDYVFIHRMIYDMGISPIHTNLGQYMTVREVNYNLKYLILSNGSYCHIDSVLKQKPLNVRTVDGESVHYLRNRCKRLQYKADILDNIIKHAKQRDYCVSDMQYIHSELTMIVDELNIIYNMSSVYDDSHGKLPVLKDRVYSLNREIKDITEEVCIDTTGADEEKLIFKPLKNIRLSNAW